MDDTPQASTNNAKRRPGGLGTLVSIVLVVIAVGLVAAIAMFPSASEEVAESTPTPVNVEVWPIEPVERLEDGFQLTGVVEPEAVVQVAAEVSGRIEHIARRKNETRWRGQMLRADIPLEEGQPVEAGNPLVYLNDELLRARYERAKAQFEYDQSEYERILRLYESGTTSQTELDDARTRRDVSKALLDEAERELERTTIVAPISGILNDLPMEIGEYATPGQPVAEIVNIDRVKVTVDVPERDVYYINLGDSAQIFTPAPDEPHLVGEITYISELADERSRTSRVEIVVGNPQHRLRSGQIVRARLTRRVLENVIMIPLGSVIPLEEGRVVYVVSDESTAERREVTLGLLKGRSVQVLSGLVVGERLIVVGHRYVGPGQLVKVVETHASRPFERP